LYCRRSSSYRRRWTATPPPKSTQLLREWQGGSQEAFDRLVPMVHEELRTLASRQLGGHDQAGFLQTFSV
jgi:hypothetical protein